MAPQTRLVLGTLMLTALAACGGGGGGSGGPATSISASPTSVSFTAVEGDATPPAPATVQITYQGAAVVAGYAPGVTAPSWLTVAQQGAATTTTAAFSFTVSDTSTVDTRSTSLRFATGLADQTKVVYADVPVTYTVTPSDLAIHSSASALNFTANTGGTLSPAQNLTLTFNGSALSVSGAPAWLTLTPPANPNASPATYGAAINSTAFPGGTTQSADLVFLTTRTGSTLQRSTTVHVSFTVVQPFDASTTTAWSAV
jgi:hypothetical protein